MESEIEEMRNNLVNVKGSKKEEPIPVAKSTDTEEEKQSKVLEPLKRISTLTLP